MSAWENPWTYVLIACLVLIIYGIFRGKDGPIDRSREPMLDDDPIDQMPWGRSSVGKSREGDFK